MSDRTSEPTDPPSPAAPRGRICIFTKPPLPKVVNTRLIPRVGEEGAAMLARAFLADTFAATSKIDWAETVVAAAGKLPDDLERPNTIDVWPQGNGDLGDRVERVLARALDDSAFAIALGADTPGLPQRFLKEARRALSDHDAVIGPTDDGGFYLLGLRRCPSGLLSELPWGDDTTFAATLARLGARGLSTHVLPRWFDIDRPDDLDRIRAVIARGEITAPRTEQALRSTL